jgi:hypothetical protein
MRNALYLDRAGHLEVFSVIRKRDEERLKKLKKIQKEWFVEYIFSWLYHP